MPKQRNIAEELINELQSLQEDDTAIENRLNQLEEEEILELSSIYREEINKQLRRPLFGAKRFYISQQLRKHTDCPLHLLFRISSTIEEMVSMPPDEPPSMRI